MKMTSPLMEHRRYHKHRSKIKPKKKSANNNYLKESLSKLNQPPRITQKRLTNKSGFNLNGAISTSPCSRGTKASNLKKGTIDFDLQRLLQDAKNKKLTDIPDYVSTCSTISSNKDDSIDPLIEKRRKGKSKGTSFPSFQPKYKQNTKEASSSSSPENNIFDNYDDDPECIIGRAPSKNYKDQDLNFQGQSSNSTTTRRVDLHDSSENSIPQMKKRPSLSVRQKFAAGIVDALVYEQKRQFPPSSDCVCDWLKDVASNLTMMFRKRHGVYIPTAYSLKSNVEHNNMDMCQQKELLRREPDSRIEQEARLHCNRDKVEGGNKVLIDSNPEPIQKDHHPMLCSKSEKDFKQRSIEAWVKAIPPDLHNENKNKSYKKTQKDKIPETCVNINKETEIEFLQNFKKSTVVKSTDNPFKILSKPVPLWTEGEKNIFGPSPLLPPVAEHMLSVPSCSSDVMCQMGSGFGHLPKKLKMDLCINKESSTTRNIHDFLWNGDSPKVVCPPKPQHSWFSWLQGSKGVPISSANKFKFNPPVKNKDSITKNHIERVQDQPKIQELSVANTSEMWGRFPKKARRSNESHPRESKILDTGNKKEGKDRNRTTFNSQYIKFSPRKMF